MINTSTAYRENVNKEFAQKWHAKGTITFADSRTYDFNDNDFWESGIKIQDSTSRMDVFEVGQAAIGQLTITFQNFDGRFDSYDFSRARFQIYIGMKLPNETIEWINKGVFTVDSPVVTGSIMVISLSDNMAKFDKDYDSTISFPCTLGDLLLDACTRCGVMLGTPEFFNSDYVVDKKPNVDTMTYRDMVSYIAQLAGCWARINNLGQLVLDWYDMDRLYQDTGDILSGGDFSDYSQEDIISGGDFTDYDQPDTVFGGVFRQNLPAPPEITFVRSESVATHDLYITGVRIIKDKAAYFKGKNDFVVTIKDNPLVQGDVDTLVSRLACKLIGFTFRPMEISALGEPSIEAGDVVWVTTTKGRYATIVSNLTYSIVDYETFSADAESEEENQSEYYSEAAKIVQEAVRNTEKQIAKTNEISEMSRLILGIYSTKQILDDGSEIEYMHDKPKLEDSRVIWKRTGAGIFLSLDGGKTYDDGVDSNGNAKFNQLWAMLIYASQIICGGAGNNGALHVKDENDLEFITIDKRGIVMLNGAKLIGGNGVLSMFISESSGDYWHNGYSDIGWVNQETAVRTPLHHTVYVPENFHIVSAIAVVEIMSMHILVDSSDPSPLVPEGWYTASNVQLLASTDTVNMYLEGYWGSDVFDIPINGEPVSEFDTWNPPASSKIQKKQVDVSKYLIPGKETMFTVTAGKTPRDSSLPIDQGLAKLRVIIIGYKS